MTTQFKVPSFISDIGNLIFPNSCLACEKELSRFENHLCSFCEEDLPLTNFHLFTEATPTDKLFWGRVEVTSTYSHLFFEKNKTSQTVLFNLKYKNKPELGVYFGRKIGEKLKLMPTFSEIDALIPVPLHHKKEFIRGYNQSDVLTVGISEKLNAPMDNTTIKRTKHSASQTKKTRFQRWDNVNEIFKISNKINSYKHIVLVDDVITTGSTLESIIQAIRKKNPNILISVVTLAVA
jgi:competence protein ComFC